MLPLGHFFRLYKQIGYIAITEDFRRIKCANATKEILEEMQTALYNVVNDTEKQEMDAAIEAAMKARREKEKDLKWFGKVRNSLKGFGRVSDE